MNIFAIIAAALMLTLTGEALAQSTPRVDWRQENQQRRINEGVQNGSLAPWEIERLERGQRRVERREHYFKSDGVVTRAERRSLNRAQNRQSRRIYRRKRY